MPRAVRPDIAPFGRLLFLEAAKQLRRKSSAKRARWAAYIGRPFPKSADDHELPDPGTWDNDGSLIEG